MSANGAGQDVVGVQVAQVGEDVDQLVVELPLGQRGQALRQQAEALQRIGGVHRPLERQVDVEPVDHGHGLADDGGALRWS